MDRFVRSNDAERRKLCVMGCMAVCGLKNKIVNKITFAPPKEIGYTVTEDGEILFSDKVVQSNYLKELDTNLLVLKFHWIPAKRHKLASFSIFPKPVEEDRFTIIFSHGNGVDIGYTFQFCYRLCAKFRINIITYDYSGYGRSGGTSSEKNVYKDITHVWRYVTETLSIPAHRVILYGNSIGSTAACYLVYSLFQINKNKKHSKIGGLVIHSGLASGLRIFFHNLNKSPWFDVFRNSDFLAKSMIKFPVYILHGKRDRIVPFNHALELEKAIKLEPPLLQTWWIEEADHNSIETLYFNEYYTRLGAFLEICRAINC